MSSNLGYKTAGSASSGGTVGALPRYSPGAQHLHWLIVALLTIQYITVALMPHIGRNTPMSTTINLHFSVGVIIVAVMAVRLEPSSRLTALTSTPRTTAPSGSVTCPSMDVVDWARAECEADANSNAASSISGTNG